MADTTKVSARGQVVIPAAVRRKLKIGQGRELTVEVEDGAIIMRPLPVVGDWRELRGISKGYGTMAEWEEEKRRERELEDRKFDWLSR